MKKLSLLILTAVLPLVCSAQGRIIEDQWNSLEKQISEGAYNSAHTTAKKLFGEAMELRSSCDILIGAWYMARVEQAYCEDAFDSIIGRYQQVLPLLDAADKALCHIFMADFYDYYRNRNRWRIRNNMNTDEADLDYKLWSAERFDSVIAEHHSAALEPIGVLQRTPIKAVQRFCIPNEKGSLLTTPTLYDLVMQHVIAQTKTKEEQLQLINQLQAFHATDGDNIRIYLDQQEIETRYGIGMHAKNKGYSVDNDADITQCMTALQSSIDRFRGTKCELVTLYYATMAHLLNNREQYVEAIHYCDSAIALFPKSDGGCRCANLKNEIEFPTITVWMEGDAMPNRQQMASTVCRNTDRLYFRIVKYVDQTNYREKAVDFYARQPILRQWVQEVPHRDDHKEQLLYSYLPAMPAGHYILLASADADFKKHGLYVGAYYCCDALLATRINKDNSLEGYLLSRTTGKPIANHRVSLKQNNKTVATLHTDSNGFFDFGYYEGSCSVEVQYQGSTIADNHYIWDAEKDTTLNSISIFTDRPIYRPGEEVAFSLLCHKGDGRHVGKTVGNKKVLVQFADVNSRQIDTLSLSTDAYGTAHGRFSIPQNALPGMFTIEVEGKNIEPTYMQVRVEVYKQPKFMVTLDKGSKPSKFTVTPNGELLTEEGCWQLGDRVTVKGTAMGYNGVPINGAHVKYSVARSQMVPFWRWWFPEVNSNRQQLTTGIMTTDDEGSFVIAFEALPDSNVSPTEKPCFIYTVEVEVTDLNGETHQQTAAINIGYENSFITFTGSRPKDGNTALTLCNDSHHHVVTFRYADLDNRSLQGNIAMRVERIAIPAVPHLRQGITSWECTHSMPREEFERQFPLVGYNAADTDFEQWPVEDTVAQLTTVASKEMEQCSIELPTLPTGLYRITLTAEDGASNSMYVEMVGNDATEPLSQDLIWSHVNTLSAHVGKKVTFRLGSRYNNVEAIYMVASGDEVLQRRTIKLNKEIQTIDIDVTEELVGGFDIKVFAVKENIVCQNSHHIQVDYTHKQLPVKLITFRDRLQPGQPETWTLQTAEPARAILTMYDAALDSYASLQWSFSPWQLQGPMSNLSLENHHFYWRDVDCHPREVYYNGKSPQGWQLWGACMENYFYQGSRRNGMFRGAKMPLLYESSVVMECEEVAADSRANGAMAKQSRAASIAEQGAVQPTAEPPLIRHDLSTLAFFKPNIVTDAEGKASITFTAPELLTRWNLVGLAWTQDLKVGNLKQQVVTQKELMVQPNVPRFLRQGDSIEFLAKVVNLSDSTQETSISFTLTNASNGAEVVSLTRQVLVAPHSSIQVAFPISVPSNIDVATYRIVAQSATHSDGEQGNIPVLSNRELVTESMAMYINGKGEKHYTLPHLAQLNSTTVSHHSLTVEASANPIWYAIQALPYVAVEEDPSTMFRFNAYYANAMAAHIVRQNPTIQTVFEAWQQDSLTHPFRSNLERNAELKQTLLEETPWLQDGNEEQTQKRQVALYFERSRLDRELNDNLEKLMASQLSNGGWSWLPADSRYTPKASPYITQSILQGFGELLHSNALTSMPSQLNAALRYVDKETYEDYVRWVKKSPNCGYENINYLYMRSFFPKHDFVGKSREAYNYYYNNALKQRHTHSSLYTCAQLAIVFYRHGDKEAARQMIGKLKERSLRSDEMGMYWRDNVGGYFWYQRPIEVQSMIIQAFAEVTPHDSESIALMQQWLLKQKQTTRWESSRATALAVTALMVCQPSLSDANGSLSVTVGGEQVQAPKQVATGYQSQRWSADQVNSQMAHVTLTKSTDGIAYGALYWQYLEDLDKIPYNEMGIKMVRKYYKVMPDESLSLIAQGGDTMKYTQCNLSVGDRVKVQILIDCDRNLEYLELKDGRASCFEPVSTRSGWCWNDGLSYYTVVGNASTRCYIDRMERGKYVVEYDLWVTNPGTFTTGLSTMQCLYAPEFRSNTPAFTIGVAPKK